MKFGNPGWLWGILVLPLAYAAMLFDEKRRRGKFAKFADQKLWLRLAPELDWSLRLRKGKVLLLGFLFLFLALARPQFGTHEETVQVSGLDVMLVLDISNSMDAEDVVPSRLFKAKHVIRSLVGKLSGDRVGVVAFAQSSYVACPLTTDLDYLLSSVDILSPRTILNQGTDIGTAIDTAFKALERGAEETYPSRPGAPPSRVMVLLSDGEDHEDLAIKEAVKLKSSGIKLYVLGIGTEAGGPIPLKSPSPGGMQQAQGFKRDITGKIVISKFRSDFLENLAGAAKGRYWNVTSGEVEVVELLKEMGALDRIDYTERRFVVYEDRFQVPLLIAIVLFLVEFSLPARRILFCVPLYLPLYFHWALGLGTLFGISFGSNALADGILKSPAALDSYLNNRDGLEAYQEGRLEDAQKKFGDAQARDPSSPELQFNQGVVQFQRGETDEAIEAFKNSAQGALERRNENLAAKALYNLGNAFAKKGDVKGAVRSYTGAVRSAMQAKNRNLEAEARRNLQLLTNEIKQQQQQQQENKEKQENQENKENQEKKDNQQQKTQKQDQEKKEQGQEPKKDPSQNSDSQQKDEHKGSSQGPKDQQKGDQQKEGQPKQDPTYQETKKDDWKKNFNSKKMDPQDADRVLSELTNRERELEERLNNQNGRPQNNPRDW